jgi:hypothetical protein
MATVKVQISGNKRTVKVTPEHRGEMIPLANMFRRPPDPGKGTRNPAHWHIKIPKPRP